MAGAPPARDGTDGFTYWAWTGGTETQACLDLAQRLLTINGPAAGPEPEPELSPGCADARRDVQAPSSPATWVGKHMVLCAETDEFRQLARALPRKGWFCVDVGAAHGHATECLAAACNDGGPEGGRVIGVEKGHEFYEAARKERPGLEFQKLDVLAAPQYLLQLAEGADCVIVDINGVRELEALAPLLALVQRAISPNLLVVKSRKLHESATRWAGATVSGLSDMQPSAQEPLANDEATLQEQPKAPREAKSVSTNKIYSGGKCVALQIDAVSCSAGEILGANLHSIRVEFLLLHVQSCSVVDTAALHRRSGTKVYGSQGSQLTRGFLLAEAV